jgi:hypothetical protein
MKIKTLFIILIITTICLYGNFFYKKINFSITNEIPVNNTDEEIKDYFLQKYPQFKNKIYNFHIDENLNGYARGTFILDDNRLDNKEKGYVFAAKINSQWNIVHYGFKGYLGICQDFRKYNFPLKMTPDCWDTKQKILINTTNPEKFYNGLTFEDKENLRIVFLDFIKNKKYEEKEIFINFSKSIDNYLEGIVLIGGVENYSAPHFFAVKSNNIWKIIYYGQEEPMYNFPLEIIRNCWKTESERIKRTLL